MENFKYLIAFHLMNRSGAYLLVEKKKYCKQCLDSICSTSATREIYLHLVGLAEVSNEPEKDTLPNGKGAVFHSSWQAN